ncbi:MAG: hypothetical protein NVS9B15_26050 [Acidobacteriaceae bacterium]
MSRDPSSGRRDPLLQYLRGRMSRSQLFKAVGLGVAAAALPGLANADSGSGGTGVSFPFFPQTTGTYTTEQMGEIVNNLLTLKTFDASLGAFAFGNAALLTRLGITGIVKSVFQAIVAQDQYHIDWLSSLIPGAAPTTATFTVNPALAASPQTFAAFGLFTGYVYSGAEFAAARESAELGQPTLAKNFAQMAVAEGESIAAFRTLLAAGGAPGMNPPNNKAFETDYFLYTRDAVTLMRAVGLIGGTGIPVTYPGRSAVLAAAGDAATGVTQRTPNNASTTVTFTGFAGFGAERA